MVGFTYPIYDYPCYTEYECASKQKQMKECWDELIKTFPSYETYRKKFEFVMEEPIRHMSPTAAIARHRVKVVHELLESDEIVCAVFVASSSSILFYTKDLKHEVIQINSRYGFQPLKDTATHNDDARKKFLYFEGFAIGSLMTKAIALKKEYVNLFNLTYLNRQHEWILDPVDDPDSDCLQIRITPYLEEIKLFESAKIDMYRYLNHLKKSADKKYKDAKLLLEQAELSKRHVDDLYKSLSEEDQKACEIYERLSNE